MTKTLTAEPNNVETMASVDRFGPVESKTGVNLQSRLTHRAEEACEALSRLLASASVTVLCPGAEYPALLAEAIRETNAVGNLFFDAQIVAVCRESGVSQLVTEDRDFNRFKGLNIVGIEQRNSHPL